ncbi:MAG: hypothetical protein HXS46_04090 [Theionarchaea archaeon]|nr:hypothetical protein [Theionarchaea archaeon]
MTFNERKIDEIMDKVCQWGNQFVKTKHFEALTEEQKECAESVVLSFTEHMYMDHGLIPERWNESALRKVCLITLPEMMISDESYFASMAPILSAFFEFLAENEINNTSKLAEKIRGIHEQIIENASNPKNWNFAKTIALAALDVGVDITNLDEMNKFLKNNMERLPVESIVEKNPGKKRDSFPISNKGRKKNKKEKNKEEASFTQTNIYEWVDRGCKNALNQEK